MKLTSSQQNNALAATEFLHPLSDQQLYDVLEAFFEERPVNPDELDQFANRLGRIAHMKAREDVPSNEPTESQSGSPNISQFGGPHHLPRYSREHG